MILKLKLHQNHLEGLLKHRMQGPAFRFSNSGGLSWGRRTCISDKLPGVLLPEPHLGDPGLEDLGSSKLMLSPTLEAHSPPRE